MKLQTASSQQMVKSQSAELRLSLDPLCTYSISVQRGSLIERLACKVKDRWTLIYPVTIGLLLLSIGQRIDSQNEDRISVLAIVVITVIICLINNPFLIVECCVGMAVLHIMAVGVCCSVVFFGSVAHNIAVR